MALRGVLVDRDGTIVVDVPYNGDPEKIEYIQGVRAALDRLRAARLRVGVLTNQSGVGRALITMQQVESVNARIEAELGPFDGWFVCPHGPQDDCECRKPKPKLVLDAARQWKLDPSEIVVIGDKQSDLEVAQNAGARGIKIDGPHAFAPTVDEILNRV